MYLLLLFYSGSSSSTLRQRNDYTYGPGRAVHIEGVSGGAEAVWAGSELFAGGDARGQCAGGKFLCDVEEGAHSFRAFSHAGGAGSGGVCVDRRVLQQRAGAGEAGLSFAPGIRGNTHGERGSSINIISKRTSISLIGESLKILSEKVLTSPHS